MLLINLYGAPGAGKSTTRADVFRLLKQSGVNCEEIYEKAKWLTWEKRNMALKVQPYLFGKQLRDTEVLNGQVDVAITDSPLLLTNYYGRKYCKYPDSFYQAVKEIACSYEQMNYFIHRAKPYNPAGRNQTEEEADEVCRELRAMLTKEGIHPVDLLGDEKAAYTIVAKIKANLGIGM